MAVQRSTTVLRLHVCLIDYNWKLVTNVFAGQTLHCSLHKHHGILQAIWQHHVHIIVVLVHYNSLLASQITRPDISTRI